MVSSGALPKCLVNMWNCSLHYLFLGIGILGAVAGGGGGGLLSWHVQYGVQNLVNSFFSL